MSSGTFCVFYEPNTCPGGSMLSTLFVPSVTVMSILRGLETLEYLRLDSFFSRSLGFW